MVQVFGETFNKQVVSCSSISILVLTVKTITYGTFSQMSPKVRDIKKVENILICGSIKSPHPNQRHILTEPCGLLFYSNEILTSCYS